jgi:hypothetical protein
MPKMLGRDLTLQQQLNLWGLSQHPGFEVLVMLMDEACRESAADPIRLDLMADKYDEKLVKLTLIARATNDFCASVRSTVLTHINAAAEQKKQDELEQKMDNEVEKLQSTIRLISTQDNEE